jgi:hypothetical protein
VWQIHFYFLVHLAANDSEQNIVVVAFLAAIFELAHHSAPFFIERFDFPSGQMNDDSLQYSIKILDLQTNISAPFLILKKDVNHHSL